MRLTRPCAIIAALACSSVSSFQLGRPLAVLPSRDGTPSRLNANNILILDHLNINHEKGRHDLLKAFYFDVLGCAVDPRKQENIAKGGNTVWANCGAQQFHLSEGSPNAQVFDGLVTLAYDKGLASVRTRLSRPPPVLADTLFAWEADPSGQAIWVTDPWGSRFVLRGTGGGELSSASLQRDQRGAQPGLVSEVAAMADLLVHVPKGADLEGVARFYEHVLGCERAAVATLSSGQQQQQHQQACLVLSMGPTQTLTFQERGSAVRQGGDSGAFVNHVDNEDSDNTRGAVAHEDMCVVAGNPEQGASGGEANNGAHVSLYVKDLDTCFERAQALGVVFVNHRFSRRAYTKEEALTQCMFRILDVVDPLAPEKGPIFRLEHEVRAVVQQDGKMYKSAPFFNLESAGLY